MHNAVMRSTYTACNGYEVKTIGDSFMVAFESGDDALRFGLEAQQGLLRQQWPDDLLTHPLCRPVAGRDGAPLWGGLRVRIGVQSGEARVQCNPVTGRCDYFGPTVNTAARLEAVLRKGGLVATSGTVVAGLRAEALQALGSPVLHDAGDRVLKGVSEVVKVWAVIPRALAERVAVLAEADSLPLAEPQARRSIFRPHSFRAPPESRRGSYASSVSTKGSSAEATAKPHRGSLVRAWSVRKLRCTRASCASVRLPLCDTDSVGTQYQGFAAAVALAADQSQGVIDSVMSASIAVTWNASRTCTDHAAACRCFLGANFRTIVHLGAASGGVLSGSIAAGRRSFAAVVGGCVDLAPALAEEAERCNDDALVTGAVADDCAAAGTAHWAQLWQPPGRRALVVMEVIPAEDDDEWLLDCEDVGSHDTLESSSRWRADSITVAFRKACTGEPGSEVQRDVLEELSRICSVPGGVSGADAASLLAERICRGGVRTRPMPALWDAADGSSSRSGTGPMRPSVIMS
eukprot:TRINITY_DN1736_c0_g1_i7.p1 TRINITY_DN1736_c0_g1~~TRINITY_DN1736_c0_g1_i7.p1  ORF type:complete len:518 (+),score=97.48 TRINITY_DN1736_c0_g1_i7:2-1555(+)